VYTPFNPKVPERQQMVNTAFVAQSYTDIHWKVQKLNATQLLDVANKVLVNRDHEEKQEANKRMKVKVSLLAAALWRPDPIHQSALSQKRRPNGRTPLWQDQCAHFKEIGHWKNVPQGDHIGG
jgi:hypothetical protein